MTPSDPQKWWFGHITCKAIPYLQAVAVGASVNTQAVVAIERYFAIFHPQKTLVRLDQVKWVIAVLWLVPMGIQIPWAYYYRTQVFGTSAESMVICYPLFSSKELERGFFLGCVFLACYLVPLCFISICYAMIAFKVWQRNVAGIRGSQTERNIQRSKIRVVRMLVTVAAVFACFWLPLYSIRMRILYGPPILPGSLEKRVFHILRPFAQWLGSANSCVNPFIYCYFSEQFKRSILAVLRSRSCCGKIKPAPEKIKCIKQDADSKI